MMMKKVMRREMKLKSVLFDGVKTELDDWGFSIRSFKNHIDLKFLYMHLINLAASHLFNY